MKLVEIYTKGNNTIQVNPIQIKYLRKEGFSDIAIIRMMDDSEIETNYSMDFLVELVNNCMPVDMPVDVKK